MLNLEERVNNVWAEETRPLLAEAYRCYSTGAARAAIVLTWAAVCADLIHKLFRLADDGDGAAKQVTTKIEAARRDEKNGVAAMLEVENNLLQTAVDLELLDFTEKLQLERLKQDRNFCAHPSLRPTGEVFQPSLDYARAHLATALETVLIHPPSQGRGAIQRFAQHMAQRVFADTPEFLSQTYFKQVKPNARRQIVDIAAKHALFELAAPTDIRPRVLAVRMARALRIFATYDRELVRMTLAKHMERFGQQEALVQFYGLTRLGTLDVFVEALTPAIKAHLSNLAAAIESPAGMHPLNVVGIDLVRAAMPELERLFNALEPDTKAKVILQRPSAYFAGHLPAMLSSRAPWLVTESAYRPVLDAVVRCAPFLQADQLRKLLDAWAQNQRVAATQIAQERAVDLYELTADLPEGRRIWLDFVAASLTSKPEGYGGDWYPHLQTLLAENGSA